MSKTEDGGVSPNSVNPLMELDHGFNEKINLITEDFFNLPSPHITLEHMLQLKMRIKQAYNEGIDGVVITHGTDTLEETAYFLDITLFRHYHIVIYPYLSR